MTVNAHQFSGADAGVGNQNIGPRTNLMFSENKMNIPPLTYWLEPERDIQLSCEAYRKAMQ